MRGFIIGVAASFGLIGSVAAQCTSCASGSGWVRVVRIPSSAGVPGAGTPQDLFCTSDGADFTINLAAYSWSTDDWVIHIYDCASSSTPTHSIGKVTINGDPSGITSLAVLVGGSAQVWDDRPGEPLLRGCVNFSGLTISDEDVRAKTRVSVAISGDIEQVHTATAGIHANQIVRLQCEGRDGGSSTWIGGNIEGDITADGAGTLFGSNPDAIGQVRAWNSISGTITGTAKNIAAIRVVGDSASTPAIGGISGDIIAGAGSIRAIYSTGPIDSGTTTRLRISAANHIGQIRTIDGSDTLLARDVNADVVANQAMADDPDNYPYYSPLSDGTLSFMEVGGDLHGSVRVGNLTSNSLLPGASRSGIFVHGICYAPVAVDIAVVQSNIVARTFTAPVTIGYSLVGTVVATGGASEPDPVPSGYEDGRIPEISVGRGDVPASAVAAYSTVEGLGGASYSRPFPTSSIDWFLEGNSGTPPVIDSVIHAEHSIGTADVRAMQNGANACVKFAPAIESPHIESLSIDAFAMGAVWSGHVDENDPDSLYATIDSLHVGCVRQGAVIWVKDWASMVVDSDMFGDIHVPHIAAGQAIQVGRIFGDEGAADLNDEPVPQACDCSTQLTQDCQLCDWHWNYLDQVVGLQLPRNPWWPKCSGVENRAGQVIVRDAESLAGQVIVNATASTLSPAVLWSGQVHLGTVANDCPALELSSAQSQPDLAPHYQRLSASLGGGAVGLVPFALHDEDCDPPADSAQASRTFLNSEFCHIPYFDNACYDTPAGDEYADASIVLDFYGPVRRESTSVNPYEIGIWDDDLGDFNFLPDYGQWTTCTIVQTPTGGAARRLVIHGNSFPSLITGRYAIRPRLTGAARLLCDGLLPGAPDTPVANFQYEFWLEQDCNTNGVADSDESPSFCCLAWPCDPDYNGDGNTDQDDVAYLVNVISGGANPTQRDPDFNRDGNVDQDDVAALTNAVAGGGCP